MYVREEARHQTGSDQQRQRNKILMYQAHIRFPARIADGASLLAKTFLLILVLRGVSATPLPAPKDSRAATQEGGARTQNKVLVIMDYEIFRKQAYRGTGSQRDSSPGVTDSIQKGIASRSANQQLGL